MKGMSDVSAYLILGTILILGWFLGGTFETRMPVVLATVLAAVVVFRRRRTVDPEASLSQPASRRLLRFLLVLVGTLLMFAATISWRVGAHAGESFNAVYIGIETVAHVAFFWILIVWALQPWQGHVSMLPCGLLVVLLCIAGGGTSLSISSQTTVALAACVGFIIASQILVGIRRGATGDFFGESMERHRPKAALQGYKRAVTPSTSDNLGQPADATALPPSATETANWVRPVFSLLALSLVLMATTAIANMTNRVLPRLQETVQEQLEATLDSSNEQNYVGGTRYVSGSSIGSIRQHMLGSPTDIALRVRSDYVPGYLRGTAFDLYRGGRWYEAANRLDRFRDPNNGLTDRYVSPSGPATTPVVDGDNDRRSRFQLRDSTRGRLVKLEVINDPLRGNKIFLPLQTEWVEARGRELEVTAHDVVRRGIEVSHPYVAAASANEVTEAIDSVERQILLSVPPDAAAVAQRLANRLCATKVTARGKASAVSNYFQSEYRYSMEPARRPRGSDPIVNFLTNRHAAHCEYFATSTVLVLRSAGVPARYVTGYVADEFDEENELWTARNRDAHAWVEAYDDANQRWFAVESTPGRVYQTVDPMQPTTQATGLFDVFSPDDGEENESFFSRLIGWLFSMRATDPLYYVFRLAQLPLFCVLVFYLWSRYFRASANQEDVVDQRCRKMLRYVDRKMRRLSLQRRPSETLYQFADRIEQLEIDRTELRRRTQAAAAWYRQYATERYQGRVPVPLTTFTAP